MHNVPTTMAGTTKLTKLADTAGCVMTTADTASELHVVYGHTLLPGQPPIFIGVCRLSQIAHFPDARSNTEWRRIFAPPGEEQPPLVVSILAQSMNVIDCINYRYGLIKELKPHCNMHGSIITGGPDSSSVIVCIETGEKFPSIAEAARAHGGSQGNLSNHLNGMKGFRTFKGRTYRKEPVA